MTADQLKIFKNIPVIKTEHLTLRGISFRDLDDIYEYSSDSNVTEFLFWSPHPDKNFTRKYLNSIIAGYKKCRYFNWGIERDGKMIGTCGFTSFDIKNNSAEIGYVLNRQYWGIGIATEAALSVIEYGFYNLGLSKIETKYMIENKASAKVAENCGMSKKLFPLFKIKCKGKDRIIGVYSITRKEYEAINVDRSN